MRTRTLLPKLMPCLLTAVALTASPTVAEPGEGPDCFSTMGLTCGTVPSNAEWVCNDLGNACVTLEVDLETYEFTVGWRHYEVDPATAQVSKAVHIIDGDQVAGCGWNNSWNGGCAVIGTSERDLTRCHELIASVSASTVASGVELQQRFGDCA